MCNLRENARRVSVDAFFDGCPTQGGNVTGVCAQAIRQNPRAAATLSDSQVVPLAGGYLQWSRLELQTILPTLLYFTLPKLVILRARIT